ncbi:hypothetical protein [Sinorhizobium meliloti]|uniref:Uncharacterized protein n=1 Tax=Rhizobium meliloti TaxID=382 RepID=A0A2J0Z3R7_RHIML|nr:hypothetical protein [Sinorhizobium meliloti]PJR15160.1 hypothetical protein CEJ86_10530 [Sinorhizobium meliloti]
MKVSFRTSLAAFALSSALAGVAVPAFADSYYQGIDPHNPPGTQNRGAVMVPARPYYVDPAPTGSVYVDPAPTGSIYMEPAPGSRASNAPGRVREHYTNEYQGPGDGDYYQGIAPPAPRP